MSKFSSESEHSSQNSSRTPLEPGQRHSPELFEFSPVGEAIIAQKIALLSGPQVSDEALASLKETLPLSVDQLIARYHANNQSDQE